MPKTHKLYCYVDETGQDTKGQLFIVVAIMTVEPHEIAEQLEAAEASSGKGKVKWHRARKSRNEYLKAALNVDIHIKVYYQVFSGGERDETNPIIRLADAVAGMVREAHEGNSQFEAIKEHLERQGVMRKLP